MNKKLKCSECNNTLEEVEASYRLEYRGYVYPIKSIKQFVCYECEYSIIDKESLHIMKRAIDSYKERFKDVKL